MKGMRGKKRKWMSLLSVLLCVMMAVPAASAAAEETKETEEKPWHEQFDTTSWRNTPWEKSTTCESGEEHDLYTQEESYQILPGPFGSTIRAGKYDYTFEATCEHGAGTVTLQCCKKCKTWVITATTVQGGEGKEHTWSETITEEATCTKAGRTYKKCTDCGIRSEVKEIPKKEHIPGEWEVKSTGHCSYYGDGVLGEEVRKCTVCGSLIGHRYTQPAHDFGDWITTLEPKVGVAGQKERVCKICGRKQTETIDALTVPEKHDHIFVIDQNNCGRDKCTVCGETRPNNKNHVVTEWISIGPRTADGEHYGKCTVCGKTVAEQHKYEDDGDCTTDVKCPVCNLVLKQGYSEHSRYPHVSDETVTWTYMDLGNGMHARKCSNDSCTQTTGVDQHKAGEGKGKCNLCDAAENLEKTVEDVGSKDNGKSANGLMSEPAGDTPFSDEGTVPPTKQSVQNESENSQESEWTLEKWKESNCPFGTNKGKKHECELRTTPATCTSKGEKYWECKYCHVRWTVEIIPQSQHDYEITELPATCRDNGRRVYKCKTCGSTYSDTISAADVKHTWESEAEDGWVPVYGNEPSCRRKGEMIRKCSVCGFTETKEGTKADHKAVDSKTDCTKKVCKYCGIEMGSSGKEHEMEWKAIGQQNANGEHLGECKNCGYIICENHEPVTGDDCTKDVVCAKCGLVVVKGCSEHNRYPLISGDNVTWTYMTLSDGSHARKCSSDGCEQTTGVDKHAAGDRKGICNLCGDAIGSGEMNGSGDTTVTDEKTGSFDETAGGNSGDQTTEGTVSKEETDGNTTQKNDSKEDSAEDTSRKDDVTTPPTESEAADSETTDSGMTDPGTTDLGTTKPGTTEFGTTQEQQKPMNTPGQEDPKKETEAPSSGNNSLDITPADPGTTTDSQTIVDEVKVVLPEETDAELTLKVENVTQTDGSVKTTVEEKFAEYVAYDITLSNGDAVVQPNGTVKVTIEIPEGWRDVDVYHVDGSDMTDMKATVEDGRAVFTTTHFSVYVLVNKESAINSESKALSGKNAEEPQKAATMQKTSAENAGAAGTEAAQEVVLTAQSPKTGDDGIYMTMVCIALFLISAFSTCVYCGRKSRAAR